MWNVIYRIPIATDMVNCLLQQKKVTMMLEKIHIWPPWKLSNFQDPPSPLVHLPPKLFHPLELGRPFPNETTSPPSSNDNQSVKRKHNPRTTFICYQVLLSGRLSFFSLCSLILHGFPLTSFHLLEASLSASSWSYALVCAVVQKYHKLSFIYNCSHFSTHFAINLFHLKNLKM